MNYMFRLKSLISCLGTRPLQYTGVVLELTYVVADGNDSSIVHYSSGSLFSGTDYFICIIHVNIQASSSYWRGKVDRESLQRVYGISFPDSRRLTV